MSSVPRRCFAIGFSDLSFSRSISEQNRLLQSDESRHIFQQVEDDKSSLLWLRDKDSCRTAVHSLVSESSDLSDLDFDFDREVFNSRAYRTAARANMREALSRTKKGKTVQREGSSLDDSVEDVESGCSIEPEDDVQTVIAEPEDSWPLKDGILVGIVTEISQPDPIICEDNVTNYGIERPISPSYDNGRKRGGAEPGPSISRKKPLPELPSSLNHMPPSAATEDSSQASSKISKNETQRQHEYVTNPSVLDHAPNTPRQPFFQRRDSLLSHFGRKKSDMPKLSNSRFSFLSGLLQQPRTSQVPSAGINKSHLATYKVLEESKKCPKVLILGTSGAGKSTLLKKMTMFAGGTHSIFQREDYRETIQNILGTWNRTTGITENILVLNEIAYRIYDVGGHKAERRKWIHCYENVEIIIFCVDISGYDSCVPEDEYVNNMQDALHLFDDICNLGQLDKTSVILLFTKIDLLQRKLASSPINSCFPDFDGDLTSLEEAKAYFASRFLSLNQNPEKKIEVYFDNIVSNPSAGKLAFAVLETCLKLRKIDEDFRSIHEYIRTKKIIDARI